ncbi:ATP-binding protein [Streptomyces sp. URMC 123]|uniref:ATP-binding protein n=1 Tax=Streptomyces sp. URMC 123 TaxID=3423403 RepID=UPI003F1B9EA8
MRVLRVRVTCTLRSASGTPSDVTHLGYTTGPYERCSATARLTDMEQTTVSTEQRTVVRRWPPRPSSVRTARADLRRTLARWGLTALEDRAVVVLSELFTNAVVHAHVPQGGQIETRFLRHPNGVRIQVDDADDRRFVIRRRTGEGGRGLALVSKLSDQWGVSRVAGVGKSVWADIIAQGGRAA